MEAMTERITVEQEARLIRARAEGADYTWTKSPLGWVVTNAKGACYQVSETSCGCQDYARRCAGTALLCKHSLALREKLVAEQTREAPPVVADEEAKRAEDARNAKLDATFERIFGRG